MEERIKQIISHFHSLKDNSSLQTSLNTNEKKEQPKKVLKEKAENNEVVKKPFKDQTPMMIRKINRHRHELTKNNLKKQQQVFISHGNIDDYEKELDQRMGTEIE